MREFQEGKKKIKQMLSCNIMNHTKVLIYAGMDGIYLRYGILGKYTCFF